VSKPADHLTKEQWKALRRLCKDMEVPLSVEFGSLFLTIKYAFVCGWQACQLEKKK